MLLCLPGSWELLQHHRCQRVKMAVVEQGGTTGLGGPETPGAAVLIPGLGCGAGGLHGQGPSLHLSVGPARSLAVPGRLGSTGHVCLA